MNERLLSIFIISAIAAFVAVILILADLLLKYFGMRSDAWPDGLVIFLSAYILFFASPPLLHSIKKRLRRAKNGKRRRIADRPSITEKES